MIPFLLLTIKWSQSLLMIASLLPHTNDSNTINNVKRFDYSKMDKNKWEAYTLDTDRIFKDAVDSRHKSHQHKPVTN